MRPSQNIQEILEGEAPERQRRVHPAPVSGGGQSGAEIWPDQPKDIDKGKNKDKDIDKDRQKILIKIKTKGAIGPASLWKYAIQCLLLEIQLATKDNHTAFKNLGQAGIQKPSSAWDGGGSNLGIKDLVAVKGGPIVQFFFNIVQTAFDPGYRTLAPPDISPH